MSDYLMRVLGRARGGDEAQPLQPFLRSTSPIAEHDQRIGMSGFDGDGGGDTSLGEGRAEAATTTTAPGGLTVQRKLASPGLASAPHRVPDRAGPRAPDRTAAETPVIGAKARLAPDHGEHLATPSDPVADTPFAFRSSGPPEPPSIRLPISQHPRQTQTQESVTDVASTAEHPGSAVGAKVGDAQSPGSSQTPHESRQSAHATQSVRPVRSTRQVDVPRLEPSAQRFPGPDEPPTGLTDTRAHPADEGPRVVIGRISVEVVPPPEQPTAAAPHSGPLTAASVSVIGPLGGGLPSDRRLSLRYR
jgi:hypothetical protein